MSSARRPSKISTGTGTDLSSWSHWHSRSHGSRGKTGADPRLHRSAAPHTIMGKKVLQCFPWYKRCKDRSKNRLCPPPPVPSVERPSGFTPTASWGYDGEDGVTRPVYFSHKARVVYRHQMEGNVIDATC